MNQARLPWILGAIAVLAVIGVLAAASYHTTAGLYSNLKSAGIPPQQLHAYKPPAQPRS